MLLQGMFYGSIQKRDLLGIVNLLGIKTEYHIRYMQIWIVRFWRWKHIFHTLRQTYSLSPWTWHLFLIWLQIYSSICVFANPTRSKKHCLRFTFWRKEWWNDYEGFNASFPHRRHQRFIHSTFKDAAGLPAFWTLLSKDFMPASCNQI